MNRAALELVYRRHGHVVLRRARHILRSESDAREILHEVFLSLLERPEQVHGSSAITTWLYSATTHACLNRLRNARTQARLLDLAPSAGSEAGPGSVEDGPLVRDLLARVPDELARVALYYYLDEMTHEEIALVLGCSRRHVGDLLAAFRQELATASGESEPAARSIGAGP